MRASLSILLLGSSALVVACGADSSSLFSDRANGVENEATGGNSSAAGGSSAAHAGSSDRPRKPEPQASGGALNIAGNSGEAGGTAEGGSTGSGGAANTGGSTAGGASGNSGSGASGGNAGSGGTAGSTNTGGSSSTGGTSSTGGSSSAGEGGSGGTPIVRELIDDLEDHNQAIIQRNGRQGNWFGFHDPSPGQLQFFLLSVSPAREPSKRAVRIDSQNFTTWGSGVGFPLNEQKSGPRPYDARKYTGISFWARTNINSLTIKVQFPDSSSSPHGKQCDGECNNHFLTTRVLNRAWSEYFVTFAELFRERAGSAAVTAVDTERIYSVEFIVPARTVPCELWIDDVSFTQSP